MKLQILAKSLVLGTSSVYSAGWFCGIDRDKCVGGTCVIRCPSNIVAGYYCDESDDSAYCHCPGNDMVPSRYERCTSGLQYDPINQICNWPHFVDKSKCPRLEFEGTPPATERSEVRAVRNIWKV